MYPLTRFLTAALRAICAKKTRNNFNGLHVFLNVALQYLNRSAAHKLLSAAVLFFALAGASTVFAQRWSELTPGEQQALAPMQKEWDSMSVERKKKWRAVAEKQQAMPPEQRERVKQRMENWSKLSPDERRKARAGYEDLKKLPPEKRADVPQKWDQYRNLPPEKQEELRKRAAAPSDTKK
jgi:hypothetical protein